MLQLTNEFSREVDNRCESLSGLVTKLSLEEQSNLKVSEPLTLHSTSEVSECESE